MSGAFASASNDLLDLATSNLGEKNILRSDGFALFNGAVTGGVGSVLGGGNFWMGAGQGLMVTAFNFLAHKMEYRDKLTQFLIDNGVDPRAKATNETLTKYKEIFKEYWNNSAQWAEFANEQTIQQWEDNTNKIILNKNGSFITEKGPADAITNDKSGKVLISTRLYTKSNWFLADRFIHEQIHSIDIISGFAKSLWGHPIENDIIEFRAYDAVRKWTGTLDSVGVGHLLNITAFFKNNFK